MTTTGPSTSPGPLAGIRIIDLTSIVLGPLASQILADLGADVIKIESLQGDLMRSNGVSRNPGMSSIFLAINRNKRSVALDLRPTEGKDVLRALLADADVLIHNMRTTAMERLGFDYPEVARIRPDIVYCVATGYGEDGPDAGKPAFDDVIQAACGLASLIGTSQGRPDYMPSLIADKTTGMAMVNAVLAALFHRQRSGEGQFVEVPMLETMAAFTMTEHLGGLTFDPPTQPAGYARLLTGGRRPMPTADGYMALLPYTSSHWSAIFNYVGRVDLAQKYESADQYNRNQRVTAMYDDLATITRERTTAEWLEICRELDLPATDIFPLSGVPEHPHLKAVGLFQKERHPTEGDVVSIRPATKFSRTPASVRKPAPLLGEHSLEVLREAGIDAAHIDALLARGVIGTPHR